MQRINENKLAQQICEREGLKTEVNIAQAKEVLKHAFDILAEHRPSEAMELIERHSVALVYKGRK